MVALQNNICFLILAVNPLQVCEEKTVEKTSVITRRSIVLCIIVWSAGGRSSSSHAFFCSLSLRVGNFSDGQMVRSFISCTVCCRYRGVPSLFARWVLSRPKSVTQDIPVTQALKCMCMPRLGRKNFFEVK